MSARMRTAPRAGIAAICAALAFAAFWVIRGGSVQISELAKNFDVTRRSVGGEARLVGVESLPPSDGEMCEWLPASASGESAALFSMSAAAEANPKGPVMLDKAPIRQVKDTYPTYSAIAQDVRTGDIFMQDENLFGIRVFDRMTNTPPNAAFSEPKRYLGGHSTKLEFNCGLYIDPLTGDIYSVNNDTTDSMVVFPSAAEGDVAPARELKTPHGSYGIAVDEANKELYMTVEHTNSVVVYDKFANGTDKFKREMRGLNTQLADPHGISLHIKKKLMLVTNHGNTLDGVSPTYGKFIPPSITFYPMDSKGNVAPLRTISGDKTQLNWPAHIWVDEARDEFYVANDAGNSVLVFGVEDQGDVAPRRVIKGPKTQIRNPMGVFIDQKNDELWVSNMGNHRAVVFDRTANGDVAPKRVIRSAPEEKIAQAIGNPGAVGYDSKREEILVPN